MVDSEDGYPEYMEGPIFENELFRYVRVGKYYHIYTMSNLFYAIFLNSNFTDAFYDINIFREDRINIILK